LSAAPAPLTISQHINAEKKFCNFKGYPKERVVLTAQLTHIFYKHIPLNRRISGETISVAKRAPALCQYALIFLVLGVLFHTVIVYGNTLANI
jgi:hypothetical protein